MSSDNSTVTSCVGGFEANKADGDSHWTCPQQHVLQDTAIIGTSISIGFIFIVMCVLFDKNKWCANKMFRFDIPFDKALMKMESFYTFWQFVFVIIRKIGRFPTWPYTEEEVLCHYQSLCENTGAFAAFFMSTWFSYLFYMLLNNPSQFETRYGNKRSYIVISIFLCALIFALLIESVKEWECHSPSAAGENVIRSLFYGILSLISFVSLWLCISPFCCHGSYNFRRLGVLKNVSWVAGYSIVTMLCFWPGMVRKAYTSYHNFEQETQFGWLLFYLLMQNIYGSLLAIWFLVGIFIRYGKLKCKCHCMHKHEENDVIIDDGGDTTHPIVNPAPQPHNDNQTTHNVIPTNRQKNVAQDSDEKQGLLVPHSHGHDSEQSNLQHDVAETEVTVSDKHEDYMRPPHIQSGSQNGSALPSVPIKDGQDSMDMKQSIATSINTSSTSDNSIGSCVYRCEYTLELTTTSAATATTKVSVGAISADDGGGNTQSQSSNISNIAIGEQTQSTTITDCCVNCKADASYKNQNLKGQFDHD